jgi:formyl-CoA transferase
MSDLREIDDSAVGPLAGIRVVDLTSMISGPIATMMLADQGADVIKVESLAGDLVRGAGPNRSGITSTFISSNRSKRSLALNLKTPEGAEILAICCEQRMCWCRTFDPEPSSGWASVKAL